MAKHSRQDAGVDDRMVQLQRKNLATAKSECVVHEPLCERVQPWHWQRCCVVASAIGSNWERSAKTTSYRAWKFCWAGHHMRCGPSVPGRAQGTAEGLQSWWTNSNVMMIMMR